MAAAPHWTRSRGLLALSAALLLGGCAVGPNFSRPPLASGAGYSKAAEAGAQALGPTQSLKIGADVPGKWWTLYQSPALNHLVEAALKANPDVDAAQAALRSARQLYLAQRGAFLPTVDLSGSATRQKASGALSPPLSTTQLQFSLYNAQVDVGFTPDLFGGVRRQTEAAAAVLDAQRFTTEATYLTLTANVVTAAIQAAGLEAQIKAVKIAIQDERDILELLRRQQALGQAGGADVAAQEALVAQTEGILPGLNKPLTQTLDQLAALTGRSPDEALKEVLDLDGMTSPAAVPLSVPAKLVAQRPDIRIAEANLHAASAQVGVAIAARLPNVSLSAAYGGVSTGIGQVLSQANSLWSIGAGVTQPIFEGGALYHKQKAAEAGLDQAKAQYRSAVITAFQNVADSLGALKADADAQVAADRGERAAARSLTIARKQVEIGDASRAVLLQAEQAYETALAARVQARANSLADTAALFQALGGGWWNRAET